MNPAFSFDNINHVGNIMDSRIDSSSDLSGRVIVWQVFFYFAV